LIFNLDQRTKFEAYDDVYFNPLFVGDLSRIIIDLTFSGASGVLHVVGKDCISKFEFCRRVEELLGDKQGLIVKTYARENFLSEKRSMNTCISSLKITELRIPVPSLRETIRNSLVSRVINDFG
jgi:dTDP-4-dehydrorhamnose reductase